MTVQNNTIQHKNNSNYWRCDFTTRSGKHMTLYGDNIQEVQAKLKKYKEEHNGKQGRN